MKALRIKEFLLIALTALLFAAGSARAATVFNLDLGTVHAGQSGHFTASTGVNGQSTGLLSGMLPKNDVINVTFTLTKFSSGSVMGDGSYNYRRFGTHFTGSSITTNGNTTSFGQTSPVGHPHHISLVSSLVLTAADFISSSSASASITNGSLGLAHFIASLSGHFLNGGKMQINFSVSAVPLPGAASLFGLGLALLAGYGMWKRRQAAA